MANTWILLPKAQFTLKGFKRALIYKTEVKSVKIHYSGQIINISVSVQSSLH